MTGCELHSVRGRALADLAEFRSIRLLVEEGLNHLPVVPKDVQTPTGATYSGVGFQGKIAGVSSGPIHIRASRL